jgi:hypothetical protein
MDTLKLVQIFVRRNICHLRCKHCSICAGERSQSAIVSLSTAKAVFADVSAWWKSNKTLTNHLFLQWCDDELSSEEDLHLHECVTTLNCSRLTSFSTNGLWLSRLPMAQARTCVDRLKQAGKTDAQISFHGLPDTHDAFVGRKGAFRALLQIAQLASDCGLGVRCQVFVNASNAAEVEALCSTLLGTGVIKAEAISYPITNYIGRARAHQQMRLDVASRDRLPKYLQIHFAGLVTETDLEADLKEDPENWRRISAQIIPTDRVCIDIGEDRTAFLAASNDSLVELGYLDEATLTNMLRSAVDIKNKEASTLTSLRQSASQYVDQRSQRLYHPSDCARLWVRRMHESNKTIGQRP